MQSTGPRIEHSALHPSRSCRRRDRGAFARRAIATTARLVERVQLEARLRREGGELQAAYEVSWAGIAVGRVETSLDDGDAGNAGYRLSWQGTTVGLAQSLFPFASAGSSEGRRVDGRILSGRFAGETRWSRDAVRVRLEPAAGTVEAWGRAADNPVGGWYGQKKGLRGRFGMYLPPLLEALGLAEVEHNARNNRMRAL